MIDREKLPTHIGIIMDGNGRWAVQRSLPRTKGHTEGLKRAKEIVRSAAEIGVPYVTIYVFSTENWKRTAEETGYLMNLIHVHLKAEFEFYKKNKIRLLHIGDRNGLPEQVLRDIDDAIDETAHYDGTTLVMAINYGGRDEIVRGVQKLLASEKIDTTSSETKTGEKNVSAGKARSAATAAFSINEKTIKSALDIPDLPDVDLLIRTGGELRLSNFLLWHAPYAELVFTKTLWPDYNEEEFYSDIEEFQRRQRRFGSA